MTSSGAVASLFAWSVEPREPWEPLEPGAPGGLGSVEALNRSRVTQCALSRICGSCALPLGRPVALVGIAKEIERNAFYAPPLHESCAQTLVALPGAEPEWEVVTTSGFEYVRPGRDELERYPTFQPNSLI